MYYCCCCCVQVGVHYDPMIAKVIAKGPDRETALARLHTALSHLQVRTCLHMS
jgi:acetyl/propionyl-CoA carboxylase alpha subunit